MHMQMARHPRAPSTPLVDPDIQTLRLKPTLRKLHRTIDKRPQRRALLGLIIQERRTRIAQRDQQVPIGVRIPIEQNHPITSPLNHMVGGIAPRRTPIIKQKTPALVPIIIR